jgi:catechol 2,3-dioxygenase
MGMAVTATIPGARFMSWDDYHHHVGLNVWAGRDISPIVESCAGLAGFAISGHSMDVSGQDPDGVRILTDPPDISPILGPNQDARRVTAGSQIPGNRRSWKVT